VVADPVPGVDVPHDPTVTQREDGAARKSNRWFDVVGVLWVIVAACVALIPARIHGAYIGPFDFSHIYGLTKTHGGVHNSAVGDEYDEVVPWITVAWTQVHAGHLPLWIRNEALGMPLAFNFGSGAFSLQALVSYLTPVRIVFWVQIVVSLVVGGTGAYYFGRVLRLHPIACAFAGTTWVLSGPFFGYLGLADSSAMTFAGWQFAAAVLIIRGTHRFWSFVLFAVAFAFSILGGNPQIEVVILLALFVFVVVVLLCRLPVFHGGGPIRRPSIELILALVAGTALSAPLVLPGLQLAGASVRTTSTHDAANPLSQEIGLIFQSFWGLPLHGSFVDAQGFFQEQWVWVGAIAVALAVVAVGLHWRRPVVLGLAIASLVALAASVLQPVITILDALPAVGQSWWSRSLIPLAFCVAMLGAIGLNSVLVRVERRRATRVALWSFGAIAVVLALIWLFGRGTLSPVAAHLRATSFVWPVVSTVIGLALFGVLAYVDRRRPDGPTMSSRALGFLTFGVVGALLVTQTVFLIVLDGPIPSSSSVMYPETPAIVTLQRNVGSSVVGLGSSGDYGGLNLGLAPNTNISYGIDEFAEYDPIAPKSWFGAWKNTNQTGSGIEEVYDFIPGIPDATVARRYGISYVLEPGGHALPGGVFVTGVGNEELYRVPGSSTATLVPPTGTGHWPAIDAPGTPAPMRWLSPSKVQVVTDASSAQVLRLRISSVPGWHATIDGKPLALSTYLTMMFQTHIPPGHHVIELTYWPTRFSEGIALAAITVVAIVIVGILARRRQLDRRRRNA
jgi:hypothetical protein